MLAVLVSVPEASVYEYGRFVFRKNNIGAAGKILPMQPETEPRAMEKLTQKDFGLCVFALDARHHQASFRRRYDVHRLPQAARFFVWLAGTRRLFIPIAIALMTGTDTEFPN